MVVVSFMPSSSALENSVIDNAHILSKDTISKLSEINRTLEDKHDGEQLLVITVDSLHGSSIEDVSMKYAEQYRPGAKNKNNGFVYLVSKDDHQDRLEVGYGLEDKIPDATAADIIALGHSDYKNGDYDAGVLAVANGALKVSGGGHVGHVLDSTLVMVIIWGGLFFILFPILYIGHLLIYKHRRHRAYLNSGSDLDEMIWARNNGYYYMDNSSVGDDSSSSSSSFSGGGGDFGGGGASGSW
jgi:uncharacterized protein